jgi:hypothetical protein
MTMNKVKYSIMLSLMLMVTGLTFGMVPALAPSCVGSAQITGAGVVHFMAGEMKTLTYTLVWTGLPNSDVFTVSTTAAPAGWAFNLLTTSVNVGSSGASGSAPIDVQVTAPVIVDTATMTVSATDGACTPSISASLTSSFASVPEFAVPAVLVASIAMLGVAFTRRTIIK